MAKKKTVPAADGNQAAPADGIPETSTGKRLTLSNCGPISSLSFDLPESGIVVFRGANGSGKSTAVRAVSALAGNKPEGLTLKDGSLHGKIEGFGASITLTRAGARRGGEVVTKIESSFDIAEFIDPKIINPESADAKRIPKLAILTGAKPDADTFKSLFESPEVADKYIDLDSIIKSGADISEVAKKTKSALEKMARELEERAARELGAAETLEAGAAQLNTAAESDAETLETELDLARERFNKAKILSAKYHAAKAAADKSRLELEAASREIGNGETLESLDAQIQRFKTKIEENEAERLRLLERVKFLFSEIATYEEMLKAETAKRDSLAKNLATIERLKKSASDSLPEEITPEEIERARLDVEAAKERVSAGVLIRKAKADLELARVRRKSAETILAKCHHARNQARGPETIVSRAIDSPGLFIRDGRIIVENPKGGEKFFHELSAGEKTRIAISLAVKRLPPGGMLTLPQEFWEGLDYSGRETAATAAAEYGVLIITAECSASPNEPENVTAEIFDGGQLFADDGSAKIKNIR